jgi:hypothetical protein
MVSAPLVSNNRNNTIVHYCLLKQDWTQDSHGRCARCTPGLDRTFTPSSAEPFPPTHWFELIGLVVDFVAADAPP